ncbi:MAG: transposase, partial [Candidatus Nitrosopolaris sp.]
VQARLSFCTYFLLYPLVITLQDWSVNHVRNLKCQPCMEAAQVFKRFPELETELWRGVLWSPSYYVETAGHVSAEVIERYIREQQTEWNRWGKQRRDSSTGLFQ